MIIKYEDILENRKHLFLNFAMSQKTLAERMQEDSIEYEKW